MNITKAHDGLDLVKSDELYICELEEKRKLQISTSARIGIRDGTDKLWRFYVTTA
jgi:3-methyladenine DNA glycosylase Mpg